MKDLMVIIIVVGLPILTGLILGEKEISAKHKERMGLINQGIIPPDNPKKRANPNRFVELRNGIVLVSLGVGFVVGSFLEQILDTRFAFIPMAASIVFFLGIGFLIYFFVTQKMKSPNENESNSIIE